jgi:hypothetical protein
MGQSSQHSIDELLVRDRHARCAGDAGYPAHLRDTYDAEHVPPRSPHSGWLQEIIGHIALAAGAISGGEPC